jgi:putative ABC transport system permease protein
VWSVKTQAQQTFTNVTGGFDAVLGARGSKLQLVLNAIYHLEASPGNMKWQDYLDAKALPSVRHAIPLAMGDSYRGYRVVGTLTNLFTDVEITPGQTLETANGRIFNAGYTEAVAGSFVAQQLGLNVGDPFHPAHGLNREAEHDHDEEYVVVGVLEPSNSPLDRVIWIPLEGIQNMSGHNPEKSEDISAVLLRLNSPLAGPQLDNRFNGNGERLTFAWPIGTIMAQLFNKIGWFDRVLAMVAYLVAVVATGSILASIYNSMNERRRDFAILRALGARRSTVFSVIILESVVIAALGMLIAYGVYFAIMSGAAGVIRAQTGVVLSPLAWHPVMLWAPLGMIAAAALAGLVPGLKAYRTDVASNLVPAS